MKNVKTLLTCLTLILLLGGINSCKKDNNNTDNQFAIDVNTILAEKVVDAGHPGAAIFALDLEGNEAFLAVGSMDLTTEENMNKDAKFRIASVSKSFLATVVLQLMEEGKISLDNPYGDYLPDSITSLFPYDGEATIKQLLNHTSGIYDFEDDQFVMMLFMDMQYHWTPWELLNYAATAEEAVFKAPGTEYSYSNTNYILLGLIVEVVSNKTMEENINNRIINPLNLHNTVSWHEGVDLNNCAIGKMVAPDATVIPINDATLPLYFEWGHGQMISTVSELYAFFNALGNGQLFTNPETLDIMLTGTPLSENESSGLGIHLYHNELGFGHDGSTAGFVTTVIINPETGYVLIACFNELDMGNSENNAYMGEILLAINGLIFNDQ